MTPPPMQGEPLRELPAPGPHPDLGVAAEVFAGLVGDWDMDIEYFDPDGERTFHEPGGWSFRWILDGRAMQDVLWKRRPGHDQGGEAGVRHIGTSVRTFDPAAGCWQVVWFGATTGTTAVLHGGAQGRDGILLEGADHDGTRNRWQFTGMTADFFDWTGHESSDGGQTWTLRQHMTGRRRSPHP